MPTEAWITPDWPAPTKVRAFSTTRLGGQSQPPYDSFNLAQHVGDKPDAVSANRQHLRKLAGYSDEPAWLEQVHGNTVINATHADKPVKADASFTTATNTTCVVMTADCLPVLFCDKQGKGVAAAHAGWRGLAAGVLEATLERLCEELACPASHILAWMGPAIGPAAFEVGGEVRDTFIAQHDVASAFIETDSQHWLMDIYAVARHRLGCAGVEDISGGQYCTFTDKEQFFSYRRENQCGRMASLIWLED